jgi:hypothetical protein
MLPDEAMTFVARQVEVGPAGLFYEWSGSTITYHRAQDILPRSCGNGGSRTR